MAILVGFKEETGIKCGWTIDWLRSCHADSVVTRTVDWHREAVETEESSQQLKTEGEKTDEYEQKGEFVSIARKMDFRGVLCCCL